jgi:hypothetical protein
MRYLTVDEVLALHSRLIATSGGSLGVRDANALDSSVAQPRMTFDGIDLYETISRKAAALGRSLTTAQHNSGVQQRARSGLSNKTVWVRAPVDRVVRLPNHADTRGTMVRYGKLRSKQVVRRYLRHWRTRRDKDFWAWERVEDAVERTPRRGWALILARSRRRPATTR